MVAVVTKRHLYNLSTDAKANLVAADLTISRSCLLHSTVIKIHCYKRRSSTLSLDCSLDMIRISIDRIRVGEKNCDDATRMDVFEIDPFGTHRLSSLHTAECTDRRRQFLPVQRYLNMASNDGTKQLGLILSTTFAAFVLLGFVRLEWSALVLTLTVFLENGVIRRASFE